MKEVVNTYYIAEDGSRFLDKNACLEYEKNYNIDLDKKLPELYVKELEGKIPLAFSFLAHEVKNKTFFQKYQWFRFNNEGDYQKFLDIVPDRNPLKHKLCKPKKYPELLGIELTQPFQLSPQEGYRYSGRYSYLNDEKDFSEKYFNGENGIMKYLSKTPEKELDQERE